MGKMNKKVFAGILAGMMVMAGSAMMLAPAQAADQTVNVQNQQERPPQPPRFSLNDAAARLAKDCNVNADQVVKYCNNGGDFRDACFAAQLAKLSGKSFNDVVNAKTDSNNWGDVATSVGVTREMLDADRRSFEAKRISESGNITEDAALKLLNDGYNGMDIDIAGRIAKAANKDVKDVLEMKKLNNSWRDVAAELNVDEKEIGGPGFGNPPDVRNFHGRHGRWDDDRSYGHGHGRGYGPDGNGCPAWNN